MTRATIVGIILTAAFFVLGNLQKARKTKKEWKDVFDCKKKIDADGKRTEAEKAELWKEIEEAINETTGWVSIVLGFDWKRKTKLVDIVEKVNPVKKK